ncbi:MAG: hypothetical protein U9O53_01305, partial [archaeon]|nr:hypothetical protein [archaeon]
MRAITQVFAATVAILLFIVPSSSFSVDGHAFDSCSVYVDLEDDIAHYEYEIVTFFDGGEDAYE